MNTVALIGNLTNDPELKTTQNGTQYTNFNVAVNRRTKSNAKAADFINCTAWGKTAEFVCKYFGKGKKIALTGSIRTNNYEKDGRKVYSTSVWADSVEFADSKNSGEDNQDPAIAAMQDGDLQEIDFLADEKLPF